MASTGAAIISAQGDTTGSVWAFRQTQISGGGGGTVTSVTAGSANVVIGGTPTVAPTVDLNPTPTLAALFMNPGSSNLTPYSTGSPATRNYLDINAPVAIGANKGALRLIGSSGTVALTIANTIDLTNVDTLNGHNLYAYATYQTGSNPGINKYLEPDFAVNVVPLSTVIVQNNCALSLSSITMGKSGTYRIVSNYTINNASALTPPLTQYSDLMMWYPNTNSVVPSTGRVKVSFPPGLSTQTYSATIANYVAGTPVQFAFFVDGAYASPNLTLTSVSNYPSTDLSIELIG